MPRLTVAQQAELARLHAETVALVDWFIQYQGFELGDAVKEAATKARVMTRTPLLTAVIPEGKTVARVQVAAIELAPGQQDGVHLHPIPVVGLVTAGEIRFQVAGDPPVTLRAGTPSTSPRTG